MSKQKKIPKLKVVKITDHIGVGYLIQKALVLIWLPVLLFCGSDSMTTTGQLVQKDVPTEPSLRKGINLGNWLTAEASHNVTKEDFGTYSNMGFDHIRLPVQESHLKGDQPTELDDAITWASIHSLSIIIDLHPAVDSPLNQPEGWRELESIWEEYARTHTHNPLNVVYQILNEPNYLDPLEWQITVDRTVAKIRSLDANRHIIVPSSYYATAALLPYLEPIVGDAKVIYDFHFYFPMVFTHQGVDFIEGLDYLNNIEYPMDLSSASSISLNYFSTFQFGEYLDTYVDIQDLALVLQPALDFSLLNQAKVYCGEFGVADLAPVVSKAYWYSDLFSLLSQHGIGWAVWNDFQQFGPIRSDGQVDQSTLQALQLSGTSN